jgi:hypothetical protein
VCDSTHGRSKTLVATLAFVELSGGVNVDDERQRSDAMNRALKQACSRLKLTGGTPVIELVAIRILELVRDGESDPDRLTEATVSTFDG